MFQNANKKIIDFFRFLWSGKPEVGDITPRQANAIQERAYILSRKEFERACTPPYVAVAAQLGNEKQQVFEAATFYLCAIAANEPKYEKAIVSILDSYATEHEKLSARVDYIKQMKIKYKLNADKQQP